MMELPPELAVELTGSTTSTTAPSSSLGASSGTPGGAAASEPTSVASQAGDSGTAKEEEQKRGPKWSRANSMASARTNHEVQCAKLRSDADSIRKRVVETVQLVNDTPGEVKATFKAYLVMLHMRIQVFALVLGEPASAHLATQRINLFGSYAVPKLLTIPSVPASSRHGGTWLFCCPSLAFVLCCRRVAFKTIHAWLLRKPLRVAMTCKRSRVLSCSLCVPFVGGGSGV